MRPRRVGRLTVAAIVAAIVAAVGVPVAATLAPKPVPATPRVLASSPAAGAVLADAPAEVRLVFSAEPVAGRSHVTVWAAPGRSANVGATAGAGHELRQAVSAGVRGDLVVTYHVVFDDGTDAVGDLAFSVGTGRAPAGVRPATVPPDEHVHRIDPLGAVLLVVDLCVMLVLWGLLRRRSGAVR